LPGNASTSQLPRNKISCPYPLLTTLLEMPQPLYHSKLSPAICIKLALLHLKLIISCLIYLHTPRRTDYSPSPRCGKAELCSAPRCSQGPFVGLPIPPSPRRLWCQWRPINPQAAWERHSLQLSFSVALVSFSGTFPSL